MAIGIGRIIGFEFPENFNYPYLSTSISEFWRRWHMTLSRWFRDYIYIPLGGSKKGIKKTIRNLFIVWTLTGLWHGANWTFVLWGFLYFVFISIEKLIENRTGKTIEHLLPEIVTRLYTLFVVVTLFILFRSNDVGQFLSYMRQMFNFSNKGLVSSQATFYLKEYSLIYVISFLGSTYFFRSIGDMINKRFDKKVCDLVYNFLSITIFVICIMKIAKSGFNPFIYFNF